MADATPTPEAATPEAAHAARMFRIAPLEKLDAALSTAVVANAFSPEDEYHMYYVGQGKSVNAIQPPYDLRVLDRLTQENNALGPCVEAMVTNVDGTGFTLMKDAPGAQEDDGDNTDPKVMELWDFFGEPWPGESFVTQRKALRRDIKRTGNGYLEIIRNAQDEVMFSRHTDTKMMRIIKLDDPIVTNTVVRRRGREITVPLSRRYRRFVQLLNGIQLVYFKEFGCPLDLDKTTGKWAEAGKRLPIRDRATEIMHFIDLPDAHTPYGVPSWISQLPSVLGSRKAEEFNVEFFDNGGIPPVLIILQGGILGAESRKAFEQRVSGPAAKKQRVNIVEMEPSGGMIDSPAQTKVVVERFGAERQQDSMFEKYDDKCEARIRRGFRLPPIFVGQAADYSFATAFASYTVAEAQVFRPERDTFDEIISVKLIPALGYPGYKMVSNPLSIEDATLKMTGLALAQATQQIDAVEVIEAVNETVGLNLKVSKTLEHPSVLQEKALKAMQAAKPTNGGATKDTKGEVKKPKAIPRRSPDVKKSDVDDAPILTLLQQITKSVTNRNPEALLECMFTLQSLGEEEAIEFMEVVAEMAEPTLIAAE